MYGISMKSPLKNKSTDNTCNIGKNRWKFVKVFSLASLSIVSSSAAALSDDKNYADQLELRNCGAYGIYKIELERKAPDESWTKVKTFDIAKQYGQYLFNGQSYCVDLSEVTSGDKPVFFKGDQARFRAFIDAGSKVNCDGTNYGRTSDGDNRRLMEMKGTTYNNNGCRSKGYKTNRANSQCNGNGVLLTGQGC